MKRLSLLPLAAAAAFAQTKPAAVAPVAPAPAAPVAVAQPVVASAPVVSSVAAPFAPVSATLLQGNAAAPTSIDDVLLSPHSSAGQKAAAFEWADKDASQAFVLWNKVFAAATNIAPNDSTQPSAPTLLSAGYMGSSFGAGVSIGYNQQANDAVNTQRTKASFGMSQTKLFGSFLLGGMDLYGNLAWVGSPSATVTSNNPPDEDEMKTLARFDSLSLNLGLRAAPVAGQQGLGWNLALTLGQNYARAGRNDPDVQGVAKLLGQVGYAYIVDGIAFYPGVDVFVNHFNGKGDFFSDYSTEYGIAPSAAISVPVFERWTLQGGAKTTLWSAFEDGVKGKSSDINSEDELKSTTGSLGLRYSRDRWAAQAGVSNGFLNRGPYFVSGAGGDLFYTLGFTVNLK